MAVGFIRFDLGTRLLLKFKELKLLTQINISTSMTPKHLAKVCNVVMLKSYLFFPCPAGTLSSIYLWPFVLRFLILKGDDLLVLRVLKIQVSKGLRVWFSFCCEHFGLCCESFVFAVNILVCTVSYLLL